MEMVKATNMDNFYRYQSELIMPVSPQAAQLGIFSATRDAPHFEGPDKEHPMIL